VVDIHDVFELPDGGLVLVMDLLEGEPLSALLHRQRALSVAQLMPLTLEVLAGLGAAHAVGVVHRDMKPDNIFLCRLANGQTMVKLLDFGIAKLTGLETGIQHSGAMTQTGSLLGTPIYMAPEQVFGEKDLDHRADFWSLGIVLYECLTGACPIDGDNLGQIFKMISTRGFLPLSVRLPALDPVLAALIDEMLSIVREDRPDSAGEIAEVIATRMSLSSPTIPEPTWLPEARRKNRNMGGPRDVAEVKNEPGRSPISLHPTLAAPPTLSDQPTLAATAGTASSIDSARPQAWRRGLMVAAGLLVLVVLGVVFRANSRETATLPSKSAPSTSATNPANANAREIEPEPNAASVPSVAVSTSQASLPTTSAPISPTGSSAIRNRPTSKTPPKSSSPTATSDTKVKSGPGGIYSDSPY
jgi:serine/threonine-protein kinase